MKAWGAFGEIATREARAKSKDVCLAGLPTASIRHEAHPSVNPTLRQAWARYRDGHLKKKKSE